MQRREFLAASAAAALGLAVNPPAPAAPDAGGSGGAARQLIELRVYHFATGEKRQAFESFLASAAVPAMNRAGVGPVGVWKLLAKDNPDLKPAADANDLYVALAHKTPQSFLESGARLASDEELQRVGKPILAAPKSDPAFTRYETSLVYAFPGFPQVLVPTKAPGRLAQLRIYESHSIERAKKKVEMFDKAGEIAIFKKVGINPVFFGQNLSGARMPCLTYMVAFDDEKAQKAGWAAFIADPEWKKLSAAPEFKDTVSNITNLVLRPTEASQI
jgi:hypothetical protein